MDTRYILPATVAASVHLVALFGFNHPHAPTLRTNVDNPPKLPTRVFEVPIEPPEDPPLVAEEKTPQPKGSPDAFRPESEEPPARAEGLTMPLARPSPHPVDITNRIPTEPFGAPDGSGDTWTNAPAFNFASLDNSPRARARVAPSYPSAMRAAGITGEVVVAFMVDETGRVMRASVVRSTDSRFEAATLRAVERWRFEPGKKDGRAVRFRMEVPVVFNLGE